MLVTRCLWVILSCCVLSQSWASELEVRDAWIREAPPMAKSHAAYMELINNSDEAVEIISILADDYVMTMLHKTVEKNGMATMEHVDVLIIPPQEIVKLEPGGLHIMLMKPKRELKAGDTVNIILVFEGGRRQEVTATVKVVQ